MKQSRITQMVKFLERKEAGAKHFLGNPMDADQFWLRTSLSTIRMALTEARRLERGEKPVQYGAVKRPAGPKR